MSAVQSIKNLFSVFIYVAEDLISITSVISSTCRASPKIWYLIDFLYSFGTWCTALRQLTCTQKVSKDFRVSHISRRVCVSPLSHRTVLPDLQRAEPELFWKCRVEKKNHPTLMWLQREMRGRRPGQTLLLMTCYSKLSAACGLRRGNENPSVLQNKAQQC